METSEMSEKPLKTALDAALARIAELEAQLERVRMSDPRRLHVVMDDGGSQWFVGLDDALREALAPQSADPDDDLHEALAHQSTYPGAPGDDIVTAEVEEAVEAYRRVLADGASMEVDHESAAVALAEVVLDWYDGLAPQPYPGTPEPSGDAYVDAQLARPTGGEDGV